MVFKQIRGHSLAGELANGTAGMVRRCGSAGGDRFDWRRVPGERNACELINRLGGHYVVEPRFGLDCLGVIVNVDLTECAPSARDLAEIKQLRHLRILDLSRTTIGDRELLELVGSSCQLIIVPDGQTSKQMQSRFSEDQLALGIGISEYALPGSKGLSLPANVCHERRGSIRPANSIDANQSLTRKAAASRAKAKAAGVKPPFTPAMVVG